MKNFISWCSFICILFSVGVGAVFCGALAANYLQDNFLHLTGWWCLLNFFTVLIVSFSVEMFILLGLKKFGEAEK